MIFIREKIPETLRKDIETEVYIFPTLDDFRIYEVEEGWYYHLFTHVQDFNGSPDVFDFIDYKALGNALILAWDTSCHLYLKDYDMVLQLHF